MTSPDDLRALADNSHALADAFAAMATAIMLPFRVIGRRQWAAPWLSERTRG